MKTDEFVDAIQSLVIAPTAPEVVSLLRDPPRPAIELVELGRWYGGLSVTDQALVEKLLAVTARHAVFGVFTLLDGSLKCDPNWVPGDHFELRHIHNGQVEIISGPDTPLHEFL